ncbi:MAG: MaoC family dehydratase [Deltaproteobacteria bacterium]|nr:MaoC family dehydratase [Deltaproteobacteria bacterium]
MSQSVHADNIQYPIHHFTSARRTITETDIVNFVNLVGLHEPIFVDMEYINKYMPESHRKRFAPAPLIISIGMGLVAPIIKGILDKVLMDEKVGFVGGMAGLEARIKSPVFPGDTLRVDGEAKIKKKTKKGYTLVAMRHLIKNQHEVITVDFTETILYLPPDDPL